MGDKKHRRKFASVDKIVYGVVTLLIGTMIAMQTNYDSKTANYMEQLATTSVANTIEAVKLNSTMTHMIEKVGEVERNQRALQTTVGSIKTRVIRNCERSKLYWPDHKGDC